jgi:hypothetical protein
MKNFKINWTNNSIKYDKKDKALVMRVMGKAEPFTQGKYLKKFENKFERYNVNLIGKNMHDIII